jgi:hypothetical protein
MIAAAAMSFISVSVIGNSLRLRRVVLTGYWIRHVAVSEFTYDMGGRVGKKSPLYHRVRKGPDREFARIIEFDRGPARPLFSAAS